MRQFLHGYCPVHSPFAFEWMQPVIGNAHRLWRARDIKLGEHSFHTVAKIWTDQTLVAALKKPLEPAMTEALNHLPECTASIDTYQLLPWPAREGRLAVRVSKASVSDADERRLNRRAVAEVDREDCGRRLDWTKDFVGSRGGYQRAAARFCIPCRFLRFASILCSMFSTKRRERSSIISGTPPWRSLRSSKDAIAYLRASP